VARWEPNARERLQEAAMALFRERGYDRTTVEEIAERAGLTERTFFRYFADKREVLFSGAKDLEKLIVDAVAGAPPGTGSLDATSAALEATAPGFEQHRKHARRRQALVAAHAELRERELIKLSSLATAIAVALRARGVPKPAANLTAEAGIAIFKSAFERWLDDTKKRDLSHHVRAALAELRVLTAGPGSASTTKPAANPMRARRRSSA
jgi:AcrR family transcriptional regulator